MPANEFDIDEKFVILLNVKRSYLTEIVIHKNRI